MSETTHKINTRNGTEITVLVRHDRRLKKSSRWQREPDGSILLRVPYSLPKRVVKQQVEEIARKIAKQAKRTERRTDAELQKRAEMINRKYFGGRIKWHAICWVGNMKARLGSCTNGGSTDGHIRISDKIKSWPPWVVDYVIAHELVHRLHSSHNNEFWQTLSDGYPLTERARGFIRGVGFAEGTAFEDD